MYPAITLIGRLAADPTICTSPAGHISASFTLTIADRHRDGTGHWHNRPALHIACRAWRQLAETIASTGLRRGDRILLAGHLSVGEPNGDRVEVIADDIGISLRRTSTAIADADAIEPVHL